MAIVVVVVVIALAIVTIALVTPGHVHHYQLAALGAIGAAILNVRAFPQ